MNATHKLIYRSGHILSISASLGLWLLLLSAIPDGLVKATYTWIDHGLTGASKVQLASGSPEESPARLAACAEHQQPATTNCLQKAL